MKSYMIAALAGLATNVQAHPGPHAPRHNPPALSKRGVDIDNYRLPDLSQYDKSSVVKGSKSSISSLSSGDYVQTATDVVKKAAPGLDFRLVDDHYVGSNGVGHVNFKQTVHGVDVDNADFNVNIGKDGKVFSHGNSFFTGKIPEESPLKKRAYTDPLTALKGAVDTLGLSIGSKDASAEALNDSTERYSLKGTSGAVSDPEARLVYINKGDELALTWRVETDVMSNWLLSYVDADSPDTIHNVVDYVADIATYEVYPWGVNDPDEGDRIVIEDPWNIDFSPFTWISDGTTNYTTAEGNNAIAQVNPDGGNDYENNYRPTSKKLKFEYDYDPSMSDPTSYRAASVIQMWYTVNKYHDLLYSLGFDEKAGNFETNNAGEGGSGNDFAILNSQDGSGTDNANFATPPDGQSGRMRMYLWDYTTPVRDCAFEADVVLHEYTHGLSNRLTGGPANSNCLNALEAGGMGEGWSDFMATATRIKQADTRNTDYVVGAWVVDDPAGIRGYPYSTNMKTNPYTYESANSQNEVHAIGEIWCTVLYEMLWNLIDKYGHDNADFPTLDSSGVPDDGRYLSMKIVMDGMALQPCNPNMITARDAILDADTALTGGDNQCEIWTAFAKRGLGENARKGLLRRTDDFTIPDGVC